MPHQAKPTIRQRLDTTRIWWSKHLDVRAFLVFQRMQRFYNTFVILAALVSGLAIAALTFPEFRPSTGLSQVGEGFLCSSAITAVLAAVMASMLLFQFEGLERATRLDLAVSWMPLAFLDLSIIEFLIGVVCWYWGKNEHWRGALIATELFCLLGVCAWQSAWMWIRLSTKGGLGIEERQAAVAHRRGADQ